MSWLRDSNYVCNVPIGVMSIRTKVSCSGSFLRMSAAMLSDLVMLVIFSTPPTPFASSVGAAEDKVFLTAPQSSCVQKKWHIIRTYIHTYHACRNLKIMPARTLKFKPN